MTTMLGMMATVKVADWGWIRPRRVAAAVASGSLLTLAFLGSGTIAATPASTSDDDRLSRASETVCMDAWRPTTVTRVVPSSDRSPGPESGVRETATTVPSDGTARRLGGRWKRSFPSPFGAGYGAGAWAGDRLLVTAPSGRTAAYRPRMDRWRELDRAPRRFSPMDPYVWTGAELVVLAERRGDHGSAMAFDADEDRWRSLPAYPSGISELRDGVWTGESIIAVSPDGRTIASDASMDCWYELAPVQRGMVQALHWTGSGVLAELWRGENLGNVVSILDPETGEWDAREPGPLHGRGVWAGDRLVYLSHMTDADDALGNGSYDPRTDMWEVFENPCAIDSAGALWTGKLIVPHRATSALDPRTGECFRMGRRGDHPLGGDVFVWTGREIVSWSGIRSLVDRGARRALSYEIGPAPATD